MSEIRLELRRLRRLHWIDASIALKYLQRKTTKKEDLLSASSDPVGPTARCGINERSNLFATHRNI